MGIVIKSSTDVSISGSFGITGSTIFNDESDIHDFRIETDSLDHALFVDGLENQVIFGATTAAGSELSIGSDVFFYASGTTMKKDVSNSKGTSVFGGDVVLSGVLYGGVDDEAAATYLNYVTDVFWLSNKNGFDNDLVEEGSDTNFMISGSIDSKDSNVMGTAVFGGDLVVSGTVYGEQSLEISKTAATHDLAAGATDTQNTRAGSVTITVNGNIAADNSVGELTISSNLVIATDTIVASTSVSGISATVTAVVAGSFEISFFNDSGAQVNNDSTFICNWIAL
jgi:hypothetical protein